MDAPSWEHLEGREREGDQDGAEHGDLGARPVSPSLKQETCIIFDWDDTILPTSWLERIHALTGGGPLRPEVQRQMAALSSIASQTINFATTLGTVIIITNSAPGWVDQSCQLFMPQILQQIRGYQIFAKPMHAPLTFKISTFRRECRQFRNIVSVGDGDAERAASLRLQAPPDRKSMMGMAPEPHDPSRRIKSVKLLELPTCQQLVVQHEMLQGRLADVAAFQGNLDLKARLAGTGGSITSPGMSAGKDSGCTLVHFSRQPPPATSAGPAVRGLPDDSAKMQGLMSLRSVPSAQARNQLPPLGRSGSYLDSADGTPGKARGDGDGAPGPTAVGISGVAAGGERSETGRQSVTPGDDNNGRDRLSGGSPGRNSAEGEPLWKVQGVSGRGSRGSFYNGVGKRKPVMVGIAAHGGSAVWREHSAPAAARSF